MEKWNQPLTVKNVEFANRIVLAPLLPFGWPAEGGMMSEKTLAHYLKRAEGGVGLLIIHALLVAPDYDLLGRAGAYREEHLSFIRTITEACHKNGTKVFAQLAHAGFDAGGGGGQDINDLSDQQIWEMGQKFVRAARLCMEAGCDGVELHCAARDSNRRFGLYGGDLQGRLTLLSEIVEGIREGITDDFILAARMGWNQDLETDIQMAREMQRMGIEMLHVSAGIPAERDIDLPEGFAYNEFIYTGAQIRRHVDVPVIVVNNIRTLRRADTLLEEGLGDMAALGKPFAADPMFLKKAEKDPDYESCILCPECQWRTDGDRCPVKRRLEKRGE